MNRACRLSCSPQDFVSVHPWDCVWHGKQQVATRQYKQLFWMMWSNSVLKWRKGPKCWVHGVCAKLPPYSSAHSGSCPCPGVIHMVTWPFFCRAGQLERRPPKRYSGTGAEVQKGWSRFSPFFRQLLGADLQPVLNAVDA